VPDLVMTEDCVVSKDLTISLTLNLVSDVVSNVVPDVVSTVVPDVICDGVPDVASVVVSNCDSSCVVVMDILLRVSSKLGILAVY